MGNVKTFSIADPRSFDGDPFEAAERAVLQATAIASLLLDTIPAVRVMVRNAELERQLLDTDECDAVAWENGPQARKLDEISESLERARKGLEILTAVAAYNPRKPPRIS